MSRATPTSTDNDPLSGARSKRPRRTLGVLLDRMALYPGGYEEELRQQFHAAAVALDINLRIVYGDFVAQAGNPPTGSNAIYDLLTPESVDGLVAVSSSLDAGCGAVGLSAFLKRYPLPVCSVGIELPDVPSITVSGKAAMERLVEHVIVEHRVRSVLFLEGRVGHPESLERRHACESVVERHLGRLPPVKSGNFSRQGGYQATLEAIDEGLDFEAIVAANDHMALGALAALHERGLGQVLPVTGFDDLKLSRVCHPPLTTVAQPFASVASTALNHVLSQLAGVEAPLRIELSAEFLLRQSCGCSDLLHASRIPTLAHASAPDRLELSRRILEQAVTGSDTPLEPSVSRLVRALAEELEQHRGEFVEALEELMADASNDELLPMHLQQAVNELEVVWRTAETPLPEGLWRRANQVVIRASTAAQVQLRQELHYQHARFLSSGDRLSAARDRAGVQDALKHALTSAGFSEACFSTFSDAERTELSLLAAEAPGVTTNVAEPERFPAIQLVPSAWQHDSRRNTLLLFPLAIEDRCFGVAAFGYPCAGFGPQVIANQVAAALRNVALHDAVIEQSVLRERSVQERRAAAQRLESIGVLAGSVAHDLNNALGPLVALPEVILEELAELSGDPETLENLRQDVESIRAAAERATGTIMDLLTLGRRGHLPSTLLDLNQSAAEAANARAGQVALGRKFRVDLCQNELLVAASTTQVGRAIANLIKNAEEATGVGGTIDVRTSQLRIDEPLNGYETIPPNHYGIVEVADDGVGIGDASLAHIFEPYYSSKPKADAGSKGLGLALVHAVMKEHEGFIDVTSAPEHGTAFRLYFPLAEDHKRASLSAAQALLSNCGRLEGLRILVVDDEVSQLKTAERLLLREGCLVETVDNGGDAYRRFHHSNGGATRSYDLILLDVTLNEASDGIDWLERIQAVAPNQQCILMSGHAAPARAERAIGKGVPWLVKPYTPEALVAMVGRVLTKGPVPRGFVGE